MYASNSPTPASSGVLQNPEYARARLWRAARSAPGFPELPLAEGCATGLYSLSFSLATMAAWFRPPESGLGYGGENYPPCAKSNLRLAKFDQTLVRIE